MRTRLVRLVSLCVLVLLTVFPSPPLIADFVRGDVNQDGSINLSDVVLHVRALFSGDATLPCADAADSDDSGSLLVTDAIVTLGFLFGDQTLPPPNLGIAGPDPTCDALGCVSTPDPTPAIIINEVHYNHPLADSLEFVELLNRTAYDVDLSGYSFSNGISYTFPDETILPAGELLILAANPESTIWRRVTVPLLGPYTGRFSDKGRTRHARRRTWLPRGVRPLQRPCALAKRCRRVRFFSRTHRSTGARRNVSQLARFDCGSRPHCRYRELYAGYASVSSCHRGFPHPRKPHLKR